MYVYGCNDVLAITMKNISDKSMIQAFTEITIDLKNWGINPVFHFMDNEASTTFKLAMITMDIKYQLVPPSNHKANNAEKAIQMFKPLHSGTMQSR